ncbi:hypothetical protein [endosymbiont GvMRE of Glomus versiforme]|uniref:hypothetical protein n=1 Tax=endosymbiont GvMRE of Glomus versiforme TaxID=2039283 RepID=UPI000EECAA6F|nr:hypothetical protein [endosymbiont GvMRE of Glomus versiforme]RHZ35625.1 hypothetical protein GvMRE_IIg254 [endosymbiont GvMRE of Glomus versiforme]
MSKKEELAKRLITKAGQKSQGFKLFIWSVVLGILNFLLDGLYNAFLMLSQRGDLGQKGKNILNFLQTNFFILFIVWLLLWLVTIILLIHGLSKWLNAHSDIEKIKLELETLKQKSC